jgi:hypothetical protein
VPIEIAAGFRLLGGFERAQALGPTVGKSISVGTLIILLPFGLLASGSKIDQFSHSSFSKVAGYVFARVRI